MSRKDEFSQSDVLAAHSGRHGGNKIDKKEALRQCADTFQRLLAGKLILVKDLQFRPVAEGELFPASAEGPASPACTEITSVTQNAYGDRKGVEIPKAQIETLMAEVKSDKRHVYGAKYEALGFENHPRTETFRTYVGN